MNSFHLLSMCFSNIILGLFLLLLLVKPRAFAFLRGVMRCCLREFCDHLALSSMVVEKMVVAGIPGGDYKSCVLTGRTEQDRVRLPVF